MSRVSILAGSLCYTVVDGFLNCGRSDIQHIDCVARYCLVHSKGASVRQLLVLLLVLEAVILLKLVVLPGNAMLDEIL